LVCIAAAARCTRFNKTQAGHEGVMGLLCDKCGCAPPPAVGCAPEAAGAAGALAKGSGGSLGRRRGARLALRLPQLLHRGQAGDVDCGLAHHRRVQPLLGACGPPRVC